MKPELLAPAGNFEMLSAAIDAGTDAIYFGIKGLNMRASSRNFTSSDLKKIAKKCHDKNVKAYLAMNTIIYDDEIKKVKSILKKAKDANIDAVICWDLSVIKIAKELKLEFHISTQASVSNYEAAEFYAKQGAKRVIFARELKLEEIIKIRHKIKKNKFDLKVEVFAHGAMCVSESGRCFMSEYLYGKSANRGECIQPCRRNYIIKDPETKKELEIEDNYVLSPKDLCTLPFLEKIYPCTDSLKIEGRGRSPEYVKIVVEAYREAIDLIEKKKYDEDSKKRLVEKVKQVYNRDFSTGFYMGRPIKEFTDSYGSKATMTKKYIGVVLNYFRKANAAEIKSEAGILKKGDTILIIGSTTGVVKQKIESIQYEGKKISSIKKGQSGGIKVDSIVRKNDKVYVWM
ncbi:MAG: peptidase U32 family protein [Candidatus Woesearchaeota archaeon]